MTPTAPPRPSRAPARPRARLNPPRPPRPPAYIEAGAGARAQGTIRTTTAPRARGGVAAPGGETPKVRGYLEQPASRDRVAPPRQRELCRHHREPRIRPSHAPNVQTQADVVRTSRRPTSPRPELRLLVERCLACGHHLTTDTCTADPYPTAYRWGHEPGWAELDLEPANRCPDCGVRRDQAHHHDCCRAYCRPCDDWIFDCPHGAGHG